MSLSPIASETAPADSNASLGAISGGVSETMLLTLWGRAQIATARPDLLEDPQALEAVRRIDFDFRRTFGKASFAQAIRARWSDLLIKKFLREHPEGVVVALGEGLETQFWRVDNGSLLWLSVDLPEAIAIRQQVLPRHERNLALGMSVLDFEWLEKVPAGRPTIITANGLLMYLERQDVVGLLRALATRFPGTDLLFDTTPQWVSRQASRGLKVSRAYKLPPIPFGVGIGDLPQFAAEVPGLTLLSSTTYGEAFPSVTRIAALLSRWSYFRNRLSPALVHARLGQGGDDTAAPSL